MDGIETERAARVGVMTPGALVELALEQVRLCERDGCPRLASAWAEVLVAAKRLWLVELELASESNCGDIAQGAA